MKHQTKPFITLVIVACLALLAACHQEPEDTFHILNKEGEVILTTHHYVDINEKVLVYHDSDGNKILNRETSQTITIKRIHPQSFHGGLAPAWQGDKAGYVNHKGEWVIPPTFGQASPFSEGRAAISLNDWDTPIIDFRNLSWHAWPKGPFGYINTIGEVVIEPEYMWTLPFSGGLAAVSTSPLDTSPFSYRYINPLGQVILDESFGGESSFREGLAVNKGFVPVGNGVSECRFGFMDTTGKQIIPLQYRSAHPFSEGLAAVNDQGKWGFIDHTGTWVIKPKYLAVHDFSSGMAAVMVRGFINTTDEAEWWTYINKNDEMLFEPKEMVKATGESRPRNDFSDGLLAIQNDQGLWGYMDTSGKWAIPPLYAEARSFEWGLGHVKLQQAPSPTP